MTNTHWAALALVSFTALVLLAGAVVVLHDAFIAGLDLILMGAESDFPTPTP